MKNNLNIAGVVKNIGSFIRRFHTLIFFLIVSGGLFVAILMLLSIISLSSTTATSSTQTVNGAFDEATLQRLKQDSTEQITPGSRQSPFVE